MRMKELVANMIWQAREEVGIDGTPEHDWWLAEQFLEQKGDDRFDYDDVYSWTMEQI